MLPRLAIILGLGLAIGCASSATPSATAAANQAKQYMAQYDDACQTAAPEDFAECLVDEHPPLIAACVASATTLEAQSRCQRWQSDLIALVGSGANECVPGEHEECLRDARALSEEACAKVVEPNESVRDLCLWVEESKVLAPAESARLTCYSEASEQFGAARHEAAVAKCDEAARQAVIDACSTGAFASAKSREYCGQNQSRVAGADFYDAISQCNLTADERFSDSADGVRRDFEKVACGLEASAEWVDQCGFGEAITEPTSDLAKLCETIVSNTRSSLAAVNNLLNTCGSDCAQFDEPVSRIVRIGELHAEMRRSAPKLAERIEGAPSPQVDEATPSGGDRACQVRSLDAGRDPAPKGSYFFGGIGGAGLEKSELESLTRYLDAVLTAPSGIELTSISDANALLDAEKIKDMMGCDDVKCQTELAGALGVRYFLKGSVDQFEGTYFATLRVLDTVNSQPVRKVSVEFTGRGCARDALQTLARGVF